MIMFLSGCRSKSETIAPLKNDSTVINHEEHSTDTEMMAQVNGKVINKSQVEHEKSRLIQQVGQQFTAEQLAQADTMLQNQALDNLIIKELLVQTIETKNITAEPATIDVQFNEIKNQFPSPEDYQNELQKSGMTEDDLRQEIASNIRIETLLEGLYTTLEPVTDKELQDYYQENIDMFKQPEQVRASHILVAFSEEDTPETKTQKRATIDALKKKIDEGADFATVAQENSDCPSKEKGGDLGFFDRERMVKPFADVAFALTPGQVSDIVETQFGYHIIKMVEKQEPRTVPLEEVSERLTGYIDNQRKQKIVQEYITKLRAEATIEYAHKQETAPVSETAPSSETAPVSDDTNPID
ncbi:peptidylprolyl isomerase [bacterium]|nr:peptidylprolyl isomerase [bacterium]